MRGVFPGILRRSLTAGVVAVLVGIAGSAAAAEVAAAKYAAIVVDAKTGKTLSQSDPDGLRFPASLTKMMTLFILFDALDNKKVTMDTMFTVSPYAASMAPSKLGIKAGDSISVRDAILSIVTLSANDIAVVIGENLAGSESAFAVRMTATAKLIGMSRSQFRNASGLPNPDQYTTARDMATLGRALRDRFPQYYSFFSTRSFNWRGRVIGNHNRLLGRVEGVDGIKTGYTRASGFNLVTSVKTDDRYVIGVVLGGKSGRSRDTQMASLLEANMRKASTGPRTAPMLLAGAAGSPAPMPAAKPTVASASAVGSVFDRIIPRRKPVEDVAASEPVVVASVAPVVAANNTTTIAKIVRENTIAEGDTDDDEGARPVRVKTVRVSGKTAEKAPMVVASIARSGEARPAPSEPAKASDEAKSSDAREATGWKIQIGATASEAQAQSLLKKAKTTNPSVLADAEPFTETVSKGSATLYRARFAGFDSKEDARAACSKLAKSRISCIAIQ
jgi:D-alanyl-D-alanine carboxypeptidase